MNEFHPSDIELMPGMRQEKSPLNALAEDLGFDFSASEKIPAGDKERLREEMTRAAQTLIDEYGDKQGLLSAEKQEWLMSLAESTLLLTRGDYEQLAAFISVQQEEDPVVLQQVTGMIQKGGVFMDPCALAMTWHALPDREEGKLILFDYDRTPHTSEASDHYFPAIAVEELLHAVDRSEDVLRQLPKNTLNARLIQIEQFAEAAAKVYGSRVLSEEEQLKFLVDNEYIVEGWEFLEHVYGEAELKRLFFAGEKTVDPIKLLRSVKHIWGNEQL